MFKRLLPLLLLALSFSCASKQENLKVNYPPVPQTELDRKIGNLPSQELPITSPVNPKTLDLCTRYLLFTDQYITASDYPDAKDNLKKASKYCSPSDPRFNYLKAVLLDIEERRKEAFNYYYKAAKGYLKENNYEGAFKSYSGMVSIEPNSPKVKELQKYFRDQDY